MSPVRPARLILALCMLASTTWAVAAPVAEPPTGPGDLVIRYSEGFGEMATPARTVVEVWGDGRVVVQRPGFILGSSLAQITMTGPQVRDLLNVVAAHGVFEFDATAVGASLRAADQARLATAQANPGQVAVTHFTDPDPTTLEVHAASYTPDGGGPPQLGVARVIEWVGAAGDAVKNPDHDAITGLRDAHDDVRALLALPGLR